MVESPASSLTSRVRLRGHVFVEVITDIKWEVGDIDRRVRFRYVDQFPLIVERRYVYVVLKGRSEKKRTKSARHHYHQ